MADILHDFPIFAPVESIFAAVATPAGLNAWWTLTCSGRPVEGSEYDLGFGPEHQWRATVKKSVPLRRFELELTRSDRDWNGTRVAFELEPRDGLVQVHFRHAGWPEPNEHYRVSSFCWAMYLRLMKRYVEVGETVPYDRRLDV